jgi:hypothetical protein
LKISESAIHVLTVFEEAMMVEPGPMRGPTPEVTATD